MCLIQRQVFILLTANNAKLLCQIYTSSTKNVGRALVRVVVSRLLLIYLSRQVADFRTPISCRSMAMSSFPLLIHNASIQSRTKIFGKFDCQFAKFVTTMLTVDGRHENKLSWCSLRKYWQSFMQALSELRAHRPPNCWSLICGKTNLFSASDGYVRKIRPIHPVFANRSAQPVQCSYNLSGVHERITGLALDCWSLL